MSRFDETKERLMTLRFWLGIVVGVIISISSWIVGNYESAKSFLLIGAIVALITLCVALFSINKKMNEKYKEIRNTKK